VLTEDASWSWIFFVNEPVRGWGLIPSPGLLDETATQREVVSALGAAVLVTGGLVSLVYAITQSGTYGWGWGERSASSRSGSRCWPAFGWWERRHAEPLMRFEDPRTRPVEGSKRAD